ncbi:Protein FAR1-RELATED SEQUENCE 7 [Hordeum vulgare]|nr:Protein FAR1-RELATED SEQUENCE 7 [Hordeum vulgare]
MGPSGGDATPLDLLFDSDSGATSYCLVDISTLRKNLKMAGIDLNEFPEDFAGCDGIPLFCTQVQPDKVAISIEGVGESPELGTSPKQDVVGKPKINDDAYTRVFGRLSSDSDDPVDGKDDGIKRAGCSSYKTPRGLVKKRRREFIKQTNCAAKMTVKLIGTKWVVIGVVPDHNHKLIDKPSLTKCLHCHKGILPEEVEFLKILHRAYMVSALVEEQEYGCECCRFYKDGLLYVHILKVFTHLGVDEIPERYILQRWTQNAFLVDLPPNAQVPDPMPQESLQQIRHVSLNTMFGKISKLGSMSDARAALCRSYGRALETELNQLYKSRKKKKKSAAQGQPPASYAPTEVSVGASAATPLRNPPKSSTKGRKRDKRYYSGIELHPKKKTKCAYYKELGHNCATCITGLIRSV